MAFKSGVIALIGRPNVGKSTLLNQIVGQKIAIATPKVQTTRFPIRGVLSIPKRMQAVFIDTPGYTNAMDLLGESLTACFELSQVDADAICLVIDLSVAPGPTDEWLATQASKSKKPILLLLNKSDLLKDPNKREARKQAYLDLFTSEKDSIQTLMVSAKTGRRVESIAQALLRILPNGEPLFDEEVVTDQTVRKIAEELIREKILLSTSDEIPHCIAVEVEEFDETNPELTRIQAMIYVEKKSQKPILIGENGSTVKKIGMLARKDLEDMLETKVFLDLTVKVKENWRRNKQFLKTLGLHYE